MEVTLVVLIIASVVLLEKINEKKQQRQRHERCRRLTYGAAPQNNGVISFRDLSERAALLRAVRSCCRD